MSWLDVGLLLFLATHALLGVGAGFLRGLLGLLGAAGAIALALAAAPAVADYMPAWVPWPEAVTGWLALVVAWLVVPRLAMALAPDVGGGKIGGWNRALGWIPGLGWGLLGTGCFLWLYAAFAGGLPPGHPVAATLHAWTRPALEAVGGMLPGLAPKHAPAPSALEQEMLALVNAERRREGLAALRWDGRLAAVGRAHSRDMIARNYFAHVAPGGGTVATRLQKAGVGFLAAGENLAFAPDLGIAHQGLMKSPGHRANIMHRAFGRLGVGIVRLPPGSTYAPTVDGKRTPRPPMGVGGYLVVTQVFAN
jgi:uncharacterized protein YkwD